MIRFRFILIGGALDFLSAFQATHSQARTSLDEDEKDDIRITTRGKNCETYFTKIAFPNFWCAVVFCVRFFSSS